LSRSDLAQFENDDSFTLAVLKLEKRKVDMIFLADANGTLTKFSGKVESLSAELEQETAKIFEVVFYYEQKMTWVPQSKIGEEGTGQKTGAKVECIVENKDGSLLQLELDPSIPVPEAAKIYPIKTTLVKSWKPLKIKIEEVPRDKVVKRKKAES
jgi:hypothetical protein